MDHKPSNPDTNSWVDDRMASLDASPDWNPDADRALEQLTGPKPSVNAQWIRLAMTTTILATAVLVLALLPWQRLWTPKPVATAAAQPVEQAQAVPPAPATAAEEAKQAPAATQDRGVSPVVRNKDEFFRVFDEQLAKQREIEAQASQATVSNPVPIRNIPPGYSEEAKKEKIQGTIILRITVRADGTVQFESFQQTLGYGLDEKAREAVEQWLFTPAMKDGVPVAKTIDVSMNFSLR